MKLKKREIFIAAAIFGIGVFISAAIFVYLQQKLPEISLASLKWTQQIGSGISVPACGSSSNSVTCNNGAGSVTLNWTTSGPAPDGTVCSTAAAAFFLEGTNFFPDSSSFINRVTPVGDARLSVSQSKFGGSSAFFNGIIDHLEIPDSDAWFSGAGNYTIDFWVRFAALPAGIRMGFLGQIEGDGPNWYISVISGGALSSLYLNTSSDFALSANTPLSINTWYHIAYVRRDNIWYVFKDGTQLSSTVIGSSSSLPNVSDTLSIGEAGNNTSYLNGWMDEIRISKGIARWTSNFSPPTAAYNSDASTNLLLHADIPSGVTFVPGLACNGSYTANQLIPNTNYGYTIRFQNHHLISEGTFTTPNCLTVSCSVSPTLASIGQNVTWAATSSGGFPVLLLHMDGPDGSTSFLDSSGSGHSIVVSGNAKISTAKSKFGGASMYVTSGWLNILHSADFVLDGDFTIDFWMNANPQAWGAIVGEATGDAGGFDYSIQTQAAHFIVSYEGSHISIANNLQDRNWHHIAFVRSGNLLTLYVDGLSVGTAAAPVFSENSVSLTIGNGADDGGWRMPYNGYIDEFRISKGLALWTSNFIPPTSAFTGGHSYSWSGTDGLFGTTRIVEKSYSSSGTKVGTSTVTSGAQSLSKACINNVNILSEPPGDFSLSLGGSGSAACNSVPLSWTASSDAAAYRILRGAARVDISPYQPYMALNFTDTSVSQNNDYIYQVEAYNSTGTNRSNALNVTTPYCPPTVTFSGSPAVIDEGQSSTLTWSSSDATSCVASGAWSGPKSLNGSEVVFPAPPPSATYNLGCSDIIRGTTTQSVIINIVRLPVWREIIPR